MADVPAAAVALLPAVQVAWADGVLSPEEMDALREAVRAGEWTAGECRAWIDRWLDPASPPSPGDLHALRERILALVSRDGGKGDAPRSLTALGLAIAEAAGPEAADTWRSAAARAALEDMEAALGVVPREAVRSVLGGAAPEPERDAPGPDPRAPGGGSGVDGAALNLLLDRHHRDARAEVLALLGEPAFQVPPGTPMAEHRDRVLDICRRLAARGYGALGFPAAFGGGEDPGRFIAVFETLAFGDLSVVVKFGVQFGLFGGSVLQLGTRRHHERYLGAIGSLELPGCFAMTETGHGSNVRDLETVARYDAATETFEVSTPDRDAGKDWIGGAARDARLATVFAQLETAGERHGVHALLVPLRDEAGAVLPGVRIEDRGLKEGLNGVDNGRIWFDGVRVPRENLLDRFATVAADGAYDSPIPGDDRRFFTMLGTLVAGRVSIAAAAISATKTALTIAIRHTARRRQFGPEGGDEVPLLDYRAMQRSLLPRLARTYGLHFAVRSLSEDYVAVRAGDDTREIEARAAGLKASATWHAMDTIRACREACGGMGYAAENRFGRLMTDADVFTTFEGANFVLLQLVAKGLLTGYKEQFGDMKTWTLVRFLAARAGERLAELDPIGPRRTDADHLRDPAFHRTSLERRAERLTATAAARLKARLDDGEDSFAATNAVQDHLITAALAEVDRAVSAEFAAALEGARADAGPAETGALELLYSLDAVSRIEGARAWFLESGLMDPPKTRAVRREVNELCAGLRPHALALVDAFGIPDDVLAAPIGLAGPDAG
ncbi:MAG TPA: acyl-CoA dehydrogenase [Longimicrobiales bacterium]|nr:acyl-CoA dehydrogenase [Longimicrobiales bacterium]